MSKKSRKRNKKILAALALAGGAAMLGRGAKGNVSKTAAMENVNIPNKRLNALKAMTTNRAYTGGQYEDMIRHGGVGVKHQPKIWTGNQSMSGDDMWRYPSKKGGRVTGIAKRGFGRALMKGKK